MSLLRDKEPRNHHHPCLSPWSDLSTALPYHFLHGMGRREEISHRDSRIHGTLPTPCVAIRRMCALISPYHALCDDKEGRGSIARRGQSWSTIASTHPREGSVQGLDALGCKQGEQQGGEVFGAVWRRGLKFWVSNEFFSARRQVHMVVRILVVLGTVSCVQRRGQKGVLGGVSAVMTSFTSGIIALKSQNAIYLDLSHEFSSHFRHTKMLSRQYALRPPSRDARVSGDHSTVG